MARLRRSSTVLETARQRLTGLKAITPKPNFGPALDLDQTQNTLEAAEAQVHDKNKRMLAATAAHYGDDSGEYEQVGGTRTSDRKRPTRKKPGAA